jgi:hypothetical protein
MCQSDRNCRSLVKHMVGGALDMPTNLGHFCHSLSSVFATISPNEREFQLSSEVIQILCKQKSSCIQWLVLLYWLLFMLNYELQTRSGTVLKRLWSSEAVLVKTNTKSLHNNLVYNSHMLNVFQFWVKMCFQFWVGHIVWQRSVLILLKPWMLGSFFFSALGNEAWH